MRGKDRDYQTVDYLRRDKAARMEGWISIIVNILLAVLKYWAGVMSLSLALVADAWHTLSDSITSVIVLISARISKKPADQEHPYGHGRAELIATMLIGVMLAIVSAEFIREAVVKFQHQDAASYGRLAIIVTVISVISKELLAQLSLFLGKKHKLLTLIADGHHHRSDALSSVIVLVGIIVGGKLWWMDAVLSCVVAVLIGHTAFKIFIDSADRLLGKCADKGLRTEILKVCEEVARVNEIELNPHHFHVHQYGAHKELTFHVQMPQEWQIGYGHDILLQIEDRLRSKLQLEATIHIDPE
jgi:cation diffusion facilitator family transporter